MPRLTVFVLVLIVATIGLGLAAETSNKDCLVPAQSGPCYGHMTRYAYDEGRGACSDFVYGGCAGNSNNFNTLEECQRACVPS